jgi:hypothetical protein
MLARRSASRRLARQHLPTPGLQLQRLLRLPALRLVCYCFFSLFQHTHRHSRSANTTTFASDLILFLSPTHQESATASRPATSKPSTAASKTRPKTATTKASTTSTASAADKKPGAADKKAGGSKAAKMSEEVNEPSFPDMGPETADQTMDKFLSAAEKEEISKEGWKERLEGLKVLQSKIEAADALDPADGLAVYKYLETKTKAFKDTNFQVCSCV